MIKSEQYINIEPLMRLLDEFEKSSGVYKVPIECQPGIRYMKDFIETMPTIESRSKLLRKFKTENQKLKKENLELRRYVLYLKGIRKNEEENTK